MFRTNHQLCPPWTLREKVTSHYENELLKPINDKVATLRCLEKKSWQQWTQTKEHAASLITQLEADAEAQVRKICHQSFPCLQPIGRVNCELGREQIGGCLYQQSTIYFDITSPSIVLSKDEVFDTTYHALNCPKICQKVILIFSAN